MDTIGHGFQGGLVVALFGALVRIRRNRIFWFVLALFVFLGALPDLIGIWGNYVLSDNWRLYVSAHSGEIYSVLRYAPPYALHVWIDSFTHSEGFRWWIADEGLWIELALWGINLTLTAVVFLLLRGESKTQ